MSRIKIGIDGRYIQDHFPGIGRYTYNLVRALRDMEGEFGYVLFIDERTSNSRYDLAALRCNNVQLLSLSASTFSLAEQVVLPFAVKQAGIALFHSPYYVKPYLLPCPSVVTIHDASPARYPASLPSAKARAAFWLTANLAVRTSKKVLAPSRFAEDDLVKFFQVPRAKVAVTYYAADERFQPGLAGTPQAEVVRRRYGLPSRYVLYLGTNKPLKNLVRLVDAFGEVTRRFHDNAGSPAPGNMPVLVLAGQEDPRYPEARQRVAQLSLAEWVRFVGDIAEEDQPYVYAMADLFVFPSLAEGFGLPPLEAMACGTAVVCSKAASLPEVVGDAALSFDPLNVEDIGQAIWTALSDENLRRVLSEKGQFRARQFSWQRTAEQTANVYRQLWKEVQHGGI